MSEPTVTVELPTTWTLYVRVTLCPEEDGGYWVFATDMPGAVSQGDTIDEALANIKEAVEGVWQVHAEDGTDPWGVNDVLDLVPDNALQRTIEIQVDA